MRPATEKRRPTARELQRRAVAADRADAAFRGMIDALPDETAIEACRRVTRLAVAFVATKGGEGRMHGTLAGAAAMAAPAFQTEAKTTAAEALFRKSEGDE